MADDDGLLAEFHDATAELERMRLGAEEWTARRREIVQELVARGWSYQRIATECGVSKSRVAQMVSP